MRVCFLKFKARRRPHRHGTLRFYEACPFATLRTVKSLLSRTAYRLLQAQGPKGHRMLVLI